MIGSMGMDIDEILQIAVNNGASDIHIRVGLPPMFRISGSFRPLKDAGRITPEEASRLASSVMTTAQRERFSRFSELDLSYGVKGLGRFRVNVFRQRMTVAMAIRAIPARIATFEELRLPNVVETIAGYSEGLVIVAGAAACGKSTTLAALVDFINGSRAGHILTIDGPMEFVYRDKRCIISQREVGVDTPSYASAIVNAIRQDADVIVVGELLDDEAIRGAVTAASRGRLVVATIGAADVAGTITRLATAHPPEERHFARAQIAAVLKGVLAQRLVRRADGMSTHLFTEALVSTTPIQEVIADERRLHELPDVLMEAHSSHGTHTFDLSVILAFKEKLISQEEALRFCSNPDQFALQLATADHADTWTISTEFSS
jgi:twitching motility protein PilT